MASLLSANPKFASNTTNMNVVVTGASSGVGFEMVKKLMGNEKVKTIIGIARRSDRLELLTEFAATSGKSDVFIPLVGDVCSISAEELTKHLNHVDVLVNNAGLLSSKPFQELTSEDFRSIYEVNVFAPARLIQMLKPMMGGERPSHIVNIGSTR